MSTHKVIDEHAEGAFLLPPGFHAIRKSSGTNASERYLAQLAERTFLSLWSYPGIYRDQKWSGGHGGDGKEVCDLLIVFEDHVIIFSDKHVEYKPQADPTVAWRRWYKKAVKESTEQIYGAERWIKEHPDRLFLDPICTQPFPVPLPKPKLMQVHRIVVAHGASEACRRALGGSGSLMLVPSLIGDDHLILGNDHVILMGGRLTLPSPVYPFMIGQIGPSKGFVHVLDDTTLDVLLRTLDTVKDFVEYLVRKQRLITAGKLVTRLVKRTYWHITSATLVQTVGTTSSCREVQTSSPSMKVSGLITSSTPNDWLNCKRTKSVTPGTG